MAYFWSLADYGINTQDEGTILEQISRTARGEIPWVDFHVGYTPGIFAVHALLMKWFGPSLIPGRVLLAFVNAFSVALIWRLAARVGIGSIWACVPALLYLAVLPTFPGRFFSFNVPYPAWYSVFLFAATANVSLSLAERPSYLRMFVLGVLAGVSFAFKPNVGLFQLAAAALITLSVIPIGNLSGPRWRQRSTRLVWWGWWTAVMGGLFAVFSGGSTGREYIVFVAPVLVAALLVAWSAAVVPPAGRPKNVLAAALLVLSGFSLISIPWLWAVGRLLGPDRFVHEVLMIGGNFERIYFMALPDLGVDLLIALVVLVGAWMAPPRLAKWRLSPPYVLLAGFLVSASAFAYLVATRPMPEGLYIAVMSKFEVKVFAITLAIHCAGLWAWTRAIWPTSERRGEVASWSVLCVCGPLLYMQLYPRSDFMHWVTSVPISLVMLTAVLSALAARWRAFTGPVPAWIVFVPLAAPPLLIVGLRLTQTLDARLDFASGWPAKTTEVQLRALPGQVWVNVGASIHSRHLDAVVDFLHEHTQPNEAVFTFPMLDLVSFLAERPTGTVRSYFFPGAPGHDEEASLLAGLRRQPPRYAVVAYDHPLFFAAAPAYYFALADFFDRNYRFVVRYGKYAILRRSDVGDEEAIRPSVLTIDEVIPETLRDRIETGLRSSDVGQRLDIADLLAGLYLEGPFEPLHRALDDPDPRVRGAALEASKEMRDPVSHAKIAAGIAKGSFARAQSLLALRRAPMGCRATCIAPLIAVKDGDDYEMAGAATNVLWQIAYNHIRATLWFALPDRDPSVGDPTERLDTLDEAVKTRLRAELLHDRPGAGDGLRMLALAYFDGLGIDPCGSRLVALATDRTGDIWGPGWERMAATLVLARHGCSGIDLKSMASQDLAFDDPMGTRVMLEAVRASGPAGDTALADVIRSQTGTARVNALWIATVVGGPRCESAALEVLHDGDPNVRIASAWVLARIGQASVHRAIEGLLGDSDFRVRNMAALALSDSKRQATAAGG